MPNHPPGRPVAVRILHPRAEPGAGPLVRRLADARADLAERHRSGFQAAGAADVAIVVGPPDRVSFGRRLLALAADLPGGLVVMGSGAIPRATVADRRAFVAAAGAGDRRALANSRFSADAIAVTRATELVTYPGLADLETDNAFPRWLAEVAGWNVDDLARRPRLAVDLDSPLDLLLTDLADPTEPELAVVARRLAEVAGVAGDARAELLVAGRTSAGTLRWLERQTRSRTRALVEERGLRTAPPGQRPPASLLGSLLDRDGPAALGSILARLADAALLDSRVLLAHRLGPDEDRWPPPEDRFAADLLLPDRIADPWLRELTAAARDAPIPILLGGHTLVGPGLPLALRRR